MNLTGCGGLPHPKFQDVQRWGKRKMGGDGGSPSRNDLVVVLAKGPEKRCQEVPD